MKTIELTHTEVRALMDSFLDGATSPAREKALYAFFRNNPAGTLPPDLESHRAMMAWYDALARRAAPAPRPRRRIAAIAGIAAAVAVLIVAAVALMLSFGNRADTADQLYASYSGSYVVRDGKRLTDIHQIYSILQKAEFTADSLERAADAQARLIEEVAKTSFIY